MGSLLKPVNTGGFMTDLERNVIPKLTMHVTKRNRYIDDTMVYLKPVPINNILSVLNSYHKKISNLLLKKKNNKISFLDRCDY